MADGPSKICNASDNNVVIVLCLDGYRRDVITSVSSKVAAVNRSLDSLGGKSCGVKIYAKLGAVILKGAVIIPHNRADVDLLRCDRPSVGKIGKIIADAVIHGVEYLRINVDSYYCRSIVTCVGLNVILKNCANACGKTYKLYGMLVSVIYALVLVKLPIIIYFNGNGSDGNDDVIGLKCLGNNTVLVADGNNALIYAAVGNIGYSEGGVGIFNKDAVLIPSEGVSSAFGVADGNSYGVRKSVILLVNAGTGNDLVINIGNCGKHGILIGHLGNYVVVGIYPSDNGLAVDLGNVSEERNVCSCRKEACAEKLALIYVLDLIDLLEGDIKINGNSHTVPIKEGCNGGTVGCADLLKNLFNINGVGALVSEVTVAIVYIHKGVVHKTVGDLVKDLCAVGHELVKVLLVQLNLLHDLLVGKTGEVNVLRNVFGGKDALEINVLKKLDYIIKGKVVVKRIYVIAVCGASAEDLVLKPVGDLVAVASLEYCARKLVGNSNVYNILAVCINVDVDVIGNDLGKSSDLVISAAYLKGNVKGEIAKSGLHVEVPSPRHLVIGVILKLGGSGKIGNKSNNGIGVYLVNAILGNTPKSTVADNDLTECKSKCLNIKLVAVRLKLCYCAIVCVNEAVDVALNLSVELVCIKTNYVEDDLILELLGRGVVIYYLGDLGTRIVDLPLLCFGKDVVKRLDSIVCINALCNLVGYKICISRVGAKLVKNNRASLVNRHSLNEQSGNNRLKLGILGACAGRSVLDVCSGDLVADLCIKVLVNKLLYSVRSGTVCKVVINSALRILADLLLNEGINVSGYYRGCIGIAKYVTNVLIYVLVNIAVDACVHLVLKRLENCGANLSRGGKILNADDTGLNGYGYKIAKVCDKVIYNVIVSNSRLKEVEVGLIVISGAVAVILNVVAKSSRPKRINVEITVSCADLSLNILKYQGLDSIHNGACNLFNSLLVKIQQRINIRADDNSHAVVVVNYL